MSSHIWQVITAISDKFNDKTIIVWLLVCYNFPWFSSLLPSTDFRIKVVVMYGDTFFFCPLQGHGFKQGAEKNGR